MTEALDLRRTLQALRRRWALVVLLCLGGLLLGNVVTSLQPPTFVARTNVLLPPSRLDAQGNQLRDMKTESHVAGSAEILERAGRTLRPPSTAEDLRRRVRVKAVSTDLLEFRAKSRTAEGAVRLAEAVAREYVSYAHGAASDQGDTSVAVLEEQARELQNRIRQIDDDISRNTASLAAQPQGSAEGARLRAFIDSLRSAQVDAARQLSLLNTRIAESRLNAQLTRQGTRVLGPADKPEDPVTPRRWLNVGSGGVLGLVTGALAALIVDHRDIRLRRREEVAASVGVPVLASLDVTKAAKASHGKLVERWLPGVIESFALREALTDLGVADDDPPVNVVLVGLPGDRSALMLALHLAIFAAAMETRTALIVATEHATAGQLRSACNSGAPADPAVRSNLRLLPGGEPDHEVGELSWAELTITVVVLDQDSAVVPTWGRRTVTALTVSSGFATADALFMAALALREADYPVRGVFLANPDPGDETTGRLSSPSPRIHRPDLARPASPTFRGQIGGDGSGLRDPNSTVADDQNRLAHER